MENWEDKINWEENHRLACKFREKKRKEFLEGRLPKDQESIIRFLDMRFDKKEGRWVKRIRLHTEEPLATEVQLEFIIKDGII